MEGGLLKATGRWTGPVLVSLELLQVIKVASGGRTTLQNPLFQSNQFPILFLRVHAAIKDTEMAL